jgi:hypothetical protein
MFTTGGRMEGVAHTESRYPKYLLTGANVIDSKVSELLGTPLLIIQSPVKVQHTLNI